MFDFSFCLTKVQRYYNNTNACKLVKACCKVVFRIAKNLEVIFHTYP